MSVRVAEARPATAAEWDAAWAACLHATFFESRAWAEGWAAFSGGALRPGPVSLRFSDGRAALLPLTSERRRRGLEMSTFALLGGARRLKEQYGARPCASPVVVAGTAASRGLGAAARLRERVAARRRRAADGAEGRAGGAD